MLPLSSSPLYTNATLSVGVYTSSVKSMKGVVADNIASKTTFYWLGESAVDTTIQCELYRMEGIQGSAVLHYNLPLN